jgi:putative transposase
VLFAIHLGSRLVHVLGVTRNPDSAWVTQQARNLAVEERLEGIRFVIRDRDAKYTGSFDEVFRSESIRIIKSPILAPRANAFAERWDRTVRTEGWTKCSSSVAGTSSECFAPTSPTTTRPRPHRGLELGTPEPRPDRAPWPTRRPRVGTHHVLGGLIREYKLAA